MTTEELRARKKALGYTNKMIAELSGVPLSTVQKIFSGATEAPRFDTLKNIENVLIENVLIERKYPQKQDNFTYQFPGRIDSSLRVEESVLASFYNVRKAPGEYTVEDFEALPETRHVELIEGNFYDMCAPSKAHQTVVFYLAQELGKCVDSHNGDCQMFIAPFGVKLSADNKTIVQPDISISCGKDKISDPQYLIGPPDLCVEVVSPSNRDHDMVFKLHIYKKYGVCEYWLIDPIAETVAVYDLVELDFPKMYSFNDIVPLGISGGEFSVDFTRIKVRLDKQRSYY